MFDKSTWILFIVVLIVAMSSDHVSVAASKLEMEVCTSLMNFNSSTARSNNVVPNILTVGMLKDRLLLITRDLYVFDLPLESLKPGETGTNYLKLTGFNRPPLPLAVKWPTLARSESFKAIKDVIFNSFTIVDANSEYLFFTTKRDVTELHGVIYDIRADEVRRGIRFVAHDNFSMISSRKKLLTYRIGRESPTEDMEVVQYKMVPKKGAKVDPSSVEELGGLARIPWTRVRLCSKDNDTVIYSINVTAHPDKHCDRPLNLPVLKGFNDGQEVYLFGAQNILIFSFDAISQPEQPRKVAKVAYAGFFICQQDFGPWMVLALLATLAILAVLLCTWIMVTILKRKTSSKGRFSDQRSLAGADSRKSSSTYYGFKSKSKPLRTTVSKSASQSNSKSNSATRRSRNKKRKVKKAINEISKSINITRRSGFKTNVNLPKFVDSLAYDGSTRSRNDDPRRLKTVAQQNEIHCDGTTRSLFNAGPKVSTVAQIKASMERKSIQKRGAK